MRERFRAGDVQPIAGRRVDAEIHVRVQAVVDHACDLRPLVGSERLLLDERRDDQHVVGRQVLRPRIRELNVPPVLTERVQLLPRELGGGRGLEEVVRRRKEEAFEIALLRAEPGNDTRTGRREIAPLRQANGAAVALPLGDLRDDLDALRHLEPAEPLGEDDPERLRCRDRRRRGRRGRRAAAGDLHDREDDERGQDQAGKRAEPARQDAAPRDLPGRRPRLRRHHAGAALDHAR